MIRREAGEHFLLIPQHEHALLSGRLAERFGQHFDPPQPREPTLVGIAMHDSGWPLHDDEPTLNDRGLPLHVFETPLSIGVRVWAASAERAAEVNPYAGLLVSLHGLSLSAYAAASDAAPQDIFERGRFHKQFELNRFQHREVERQQELRERLGLRTDIPLRFGLAEGGTDEAEDRLSYNFRLLQLMDRLSLAACCSEEVFPTLEMPPRPEAEAVAMGVMRSEGEIAVDPWPFDHPELVEDVPCCRVPARAFQSEQEFREICAAASTEKIKLRFHA